MQFSAQAPLRLRPKLDDLAALIGYVESFAEAHGLRAGDAFALSLAAEELFANTIRHSQPAATLVEFFLVLDDGMAVAHYVDDGPAYDPTRKEAPDTTLSAEERPIGGLGIHLISKTMQEFCYSRTGSRNQITFSRRLSH